MRLALSLAREKVLQGTGGPFGAVVFREPGHALVSVGVNTVGRLTNSAAQAEMLSFMAGGSPGRVPAVPGTEWPDLPWLINKGNIRDHFVKNP